MQLISHCLYFGLVKCSPFQYDFYNDGYVAESDWTSESDSEDEKRPVPVEVTRLHSLLKRDITNANDTEVTEVETEETLVGALEIVVDEVNNSTEVYEETPMPDKAETIGESLLKILSPLNFFIHKELSAVTPSEIVIHGKKSVANKTEEKEQQAIAIEITEETTTDVTTVVITTEKTEKRDVNSTTTEKAPIRSTTITSSPSEVPSSSTSTTQSSSSESSTKTSASSSSSSSEESSEGTTENSSSRTFEVSLPNSAPIQVKLNNDVPGGAVITDDIVQKIAEIQAQPVILTQGI